LSVAATKPLVAYPNSGAIFDAVSKTWSEEISVEQVFSTDAKCWHQKGAKLIGGCCCSTAEDIARLARTFGQVK
jgi:homocysteine S-methyltransferase